MASLVFKRKELKYKLTYEQYIKLENLMSKYMVLDQHNKHIIYNLYYDTDDYKIIRSSIEKPQYKEKLRIRKYNEDQNLFIELKKKHDGIVFKRRMMISKKHFDYSLNSLNPINQIEKEIFYFIKRYETISPKALIYYNRQAYFGIENKDFRITFDFDIKARIENVDLQSNEIKDFNILKGNYILLEVKTVTGLPFWLLQFFSQNKIYKTSFSKYGNLYKDHIYPKLQTERR